MKYQDDRTEDQRRTHYLGIVARDKFWGGAKGGASRVAWAVDPVTVNPDRAENWVKDRGDMTRVSVVDLRTYRVPRGTAHFHVYVVTPNHPAAKH